jgi:hypothetical protein
MSAREHRELRRRRCLRGGRGGPLQQVVPADEEPVQRPQHRVAVRDALLEQLCKQIQAAGEGAP